MDKEAMIMAYLPLAKAIARKVSDQYGEVGQSLLDEIRACTFLALCESAEKFDRSYGCKFGTLVRHRVYGAALDRIRTEFKWMHRYKPLFEDDEGNVLLQPEYDSSSEEEKIRMTEEELTAVLDTVPLEKQERQVCDAVLHDNESFRTIGKQLDVTGQRAHAIYKSAVLKIERVLGWEK